MDLNRFSFNTRIENNFPDRLSQEECLNILLEYSELKSPNWSEIHNFIDELEVSDEIKSELKNISPFNYIGYS